MGLFSSKTKISVSTVAYNMSGDAADRSNFLKQTLTYLTAADESIGERLPRMYLNSLGVKIKRAYRWAAQSDQGLPTASVDLWQYQDFQDAVQAMLDSEYGPLRYRVVDAYLAKSNTAPAIEDYLNQKYGWDSVTRKMASPPPGFSSTADVTWFQKTYQTVFDEDDLINSGYMSKFRAPVVNRSYRVEFRHLPETVEPDLVVTVSLSALNGSNDSVLMAMVSEFVTKTRSDKTVTRPFATGDVNSTTQSPTTAIAGSRITETMTTVTITTDGTTTKIRTKIVDSTTSEAKVRSYELGQNLYPTLDTIWISHANIEKTYFPSLVFRVDNEDVMDDKYANSDSYQSTTKVCTLMGMDATSIRDMINTNKSIKDIDYAFLQAGANMNTESQAEMDYLFRFWEMCEQRQTATEADLIAWKAQGYDSRPVPKTNRINIQDNQSQNGAYKIAIEWDWVKKVLVTGQVAPSAKVGQCAIVKGATQTDGISVGNLYWSLDSTVVSIRKQINPTQYEEIQISGAIHKNDVYQGHTVETLASDARANPTEHEGFLIPLHMGIFDSMSLAKRTQLAQECMYMVFNCYVKTKQKWYQSGIFKWILAIVLIIITIFTWGAAAPATSAVWGAATVAGALGITAALGILIVGMILSAVYAYMASYLLGKWKNGFVSVFGKKWAGVVMAIISIVVNAYAGGGFTSQGWLKTAVQIIDVASQLFTAYAKGVMITRQEDYDAFMDKAEEDKKLLDKLSTEFFGDDDLISVDYLLELQKTLREDSPTTFLSRTLMTGSDVVDITLGQVSEMVALNTTPRLQGIFT